ncbi:HAD-IA family hydrolase [Henriciella sp.]|uniref:HAD-IA family hydrolase n=1 Tax=Henriciella sp. TaxID=1968823 RepID=UPI00261913BA|nr:HAD-IA family hydrolase [Henriciella sp.]
MTLKLAIWDMDGTIVDSREVIQTAMCRAFGMCGLPEPAYEETRKIVGLGLDEACRTLAPDYDDLPGLVEAYRQAFIARRTEKGFREPLYEGAIETLERLANDNWLIAMATGKSHRGIRAIFEMHPLEQYFDTIWCADDGPGKPHPFMVEQCMGTLGCEPNQSLIIGDAIHDIAMGRNAGIHTMGVSWGFGRTEELDAAGAHEVHHDFRSLGDGLQKFAAKRFNLDGTGVSV